MNLGERQAYETGRKDGWQEAIVAMASGAKKLLGPETVKILADALVAGLREQPAAGGDPTDPTEPASWGRSADGSSWECPNCCADMLVVDAFSIVAGGSVAGGPFECNRCHCLFNRHGFVQTSHQTIGTRPGDEDRHTVGEHR